MKLHTSEPREADCPNLSALVFRSKASHGYSDAFMELCRDEILVTPDSLKRGPSRMAWTTNRGAPIGFVQIAQGGVEDCELEGLFVAPEAQKLGLGTELLRWALESARSLGCTRMRIHSDPKALAFYLARGAVQVGLSPSGSIPGRQLPRLILEL